VHDRLGDRPPRSSPRPPDAPERLSELQERVESLQRELGRLEGARELEAVTRATLEEQLARERDRADRLEEELREERNKGFWRKLFGG
jgi:hypothetical protein